MVCHVAEVVVFAYLSKCPQPPNLYYVMIHVTETKTPDRPEIGLESSYLMKDDLKNHPSKFCYLPEKKTVRVSSISRIAVHRDGIFHFLHGTVTFRCTI